ncbi:MAG: ABC transporter ATP-binding protein [Halobacteriaceae archaeon]
MGTVIDQSAGDGVSLTDITVRFGDVTGLSDVTIDIDEGEFFTLVGPSGCGKTTTLRTVAGFETPVQGTVRIGGKDVSGVPPEDRAVGIVFQNYALFPHMSVRENVAYGLRFREPPGPVTPAERVDRLLELVDMAGMDDREPTSLSGGQQQRVALARALAPGPDVLLLDEPLSALDARLRERLRLTVRDIQRELGITTIYVTHDQAEALAISDRVAVMNEGRIEQVGQPETVYRKPGSRFVAEFVGDTNLLEGTVTRETPPTVEVENTELPLPDGTTPSPGTNVTLCVRPETLVLAEGDVEPHLRAEVEAVEFTGATYRVHCRYGDRSLLVTTRSREAPTGTIGLRLDPERIHLLEDE